MWVRFPSPAPGIRATPGCRRKALGVGAKNRRAAV